MLEKFKEIKKNLKREIEVYKLVIKDKRTPKTAKVLLWIAVAYTLSPVDIIPDFIPLIGHLDDVIIVPFFVITALKMIPEEIINEYREKLKASNPKI